MDNGDDGLLERNSLYGVFTPSGPSERARCVRLIEDGYSLGISSHFGRQPIPRDGAKKSNEHLAALRRRAKIHAATSGNGGSTHM